MIGCISAFGEYVHGLLDDAAVLEEVDGETGARHHARRIERHFQVLAEARRVIVDARAGIAECLHDRLSDEDLVLQVTIGGLP